MNYLINVPTSIQDIDFNHINDDIPRYGDEFDYNGETSNWCVYVHINKINNKMYFGVSSNLKDRWCGSGIRYKGCNAFYNAIQKYGFNSFEHIVLMNGLTETMSKAIENYLIIKFGTLAETKTGYNVLHDQSNPFSNTHDDNFHSHNTSAIPIHQYDMNGIYIQSFSCLNEAMITVKGNYIGDGIKKCLSNEHPFAYGFLWSLELVDQMEPYRPNDCKFWDEYHKADNQYGIIVQLSTTGEFVKKYKNVNYYSDDSRERRMVIECCKQHYITMYGYIWMFYDDYINPSAIQDRVKKYKDAKDYVHAYKKIIQYDTDGNKIQEFESLKAACIATNICNSSIRAVCAEKYGLAGGFQWRYATDAAPGKLNYKPSRTTKMVAQIDDTGSVIKIYSSLKEAHQETKITQYRIKRCANGLLNETDGIIWRFVDNDGNIIENGGE